MPYRDKEKERASKRKWWRENRGKGSSLETTVKLEPELLEPPLEPVKTKEVFIGGRRFNVPC